MFRISFQNSGGELDSRTVKSEKEAAEAVIEMIQSAGELYSGDKILVTDLDD